jgi:hypothetical protein
MRLSRFAISAFVVLLIATATTALAIAATITSSGPGVLTGNLAAGTSAVFTDPNTGLTIVCTTHTVRVRTGNIRRVGVSANTSAIINAGDNTYSSSDSTSPVCNYVAGLVRGLGRVDITPPCDWVLTAVTDRAGTVTVPGGCVRINLTSGALAGCVITVDGVSVPVLLSNTRRQKPPTTRASLVVRNAPLTTTNRGCPTASTRGALQTETIEIDTLSFSAT